MCALPGNWNSPSHAGTWALSHHRRGIKRGLSTAMPRAVPLHPASQGHQEGSAALVGIVGLLKINLYALRKEDAAFRSLLSSVHAAFFRITSPQAIAASARAFAACASPDVPAALRDAATVAASKAAGDAVAQLREAADKVAEAAGRGELEAEEGSAGDSADGLVDEGLRPRDPTLFALAVALDRTLALLAASPAGVEVRGADAGAMAALEVAGGGTDVGPAVLRSAGALALSVVSGKMKGLVEEEVRERAGRDWESVCCGDDTRCTGTTW